MKKGPSWTKEHQRLLEHLVKSGEIDSKEIGPVRRAKAIMAEKKELFLWNGKKYLMRSFSRTKTETRQLVINKLKSLKKWAKIAMRAKLIRRLKRDVVALQHAADRMRRRLYHMHGRSITDALLLEGMDRFRWALNRTGKADPKDEKHREIVARALKESQENTMLLAEELKRCGETGTMNALQESQAAIAEIMADIAAGVKQKDKKHKAA